MFHIALHFATPALLVAAFFRDKWQTAYLVMIATMLVDLDHLFATPVYEAARCGIGFHPLHSLWFLVLYALLCLIPKTRWVGLGLCLHMALDAIDCQVTNGVWIV